jgi:hypothetical protein
MMQILGYTIPALVVLLCTWIILYLTTRQEERKRLFELQRASQKEITAVRLRAYERLSLLLERTQPEAMLMNESSMAHQMAQDIKGIYTMSDLQRELLRTVRLEFDHNMSQQIYVSDETWDKIILARDEMAAFINTIGIQMKKDCTAMDFAKSLLTAYVSNGETPHQKAIYALKEEVRSTLNC